MSYTPGPWVACTLATPEHSPEFGIYAENSPRDLARVFGVNSAANAMLIEASPDLLEEACTLLETVDSWGGTVHERHLAGLRAAVLKAIGPL